MRRAVAVLALLLAFTLSGCVEGDPGETTADTGTSDDGVVLVDEETGERRIVRALPVIFDGSTLETVEEEDGTYDAGEHWNLHGEFLDEAGVDSGSSHVRDITDKVPKGLPVRLVAEVNADLEHGDLDLWFNVPQAEIWTFDFEAPIGGYSRLEMGIVHESDDPVEVVVFYDEAEPATEVEYLLSLEVHADPWTLLPGVPVAVPVPADASSLELRFDGSGSPVWLWGPDDSFLGRIPSESGVANHTFPSGTRGGDHVVMLPEGAEPARVTVFAPVANGEEAQPLGFGLLGQDIQETDPAPIDANEEATYTYELDRVPIQTGLHVMIDDVTRDAFATLTSPEGTLFDVEIRSDLPFLGLGPDGMIGFTWLTELGAEGLAAGSYTGTFSGDPHGDGAISAWVVHYARR